ncbi:hypothetical protein BDZ94DRAFT_1327555 [Collybia nuda]|uniref:Uncharacterized protein n=1 Tax=Collybia nuda TaxID=64659 RepID=A0A9P5XQ06_9AGAR|nr:hypothetical protein BDZ94DRAFT_1327555 [Collybia nuda]
MSIDALEFASLALDTASPSLAVLQSALKSCQIELQQAREEIRQLKIENETLKARTSISTASTLTSASTSALSGGRVITWLKSPRLHHRAQDIINFAKKVAAMEELWLSESVFMQPYPTTVPTLAERHASPDAYNHYIVHMLYANLDPSMHQFFEHLPAFRDGVLHQQTEFRSAVVSSGRKHLLQIMAGFNIPAACSQRTHDCSQEPVCVRLLSWTHSATHDTIKYDLYPPLVYEDINNKKSRLFYQPALMRIARIILFGPTALTKLALPPKSSGLKWGVIKTTPGLILVCVTIVSSNIKY